MSLKKITYLRCFFTDDEHCYRETETLFTHTIAIVHSTVRCTTPHHTTLNNLTLLHNQFRGFALGGKGNVLESPLSASTNTRTPSTKSSAGSTVRSINRSGVRSQGSDTSPGDADVLEVSTEVVGVRTGVVDEIVDPSNHSLRLLIFLTLLAFNCIFNVCPPVSTSKYPLPVREAR
jgi:hypothetical protein